MKGTIDAISQLPPSHSVSTALLCEDVTPKIPHLNHHHKTDSSAKIKSLYCELTHVFFFNSCLSVHPKRQQQQQQEQCKINLEDLCMGRSLGNSKPLGAQWFILAQGLAGFVSAPEMVLILGPNCFSFLDSLYLFDSHFQVRAIISSMLWI